MLQQLPAVGILLIAANVMASMKGFKDDLFFDRFKFQIESIKNGEYRRFIGAGFLHVNTTHLLFNMITFYFFVSIVVDAIGSFSLLLLYFISLLMGNFFAYLFHYKQPYYTAVGASGAVTGVLFSALLLYPNLELMLFFIPIPIPGYLFGIGYLLYTLYGMKAQNDSIGHTAHFGGAVGGILVTLFFDFEAVFNSQLMLGVLTLTVLIAGFFLYRNK